MDEKDQKIENLNRLLYNVQQQHITDMRDFAHQFMKLSTDLINMQFIQQPQSTEPPVEDEVKPEDLDPSMTGGEISA